MSEELKINSYPKHIGDWRSGTAKMSLAEEGAYSRLCDQYYLDGGNGWDVNECLRICRAISRSEQRVVMSVLETKFVKTKTGFSHHGIDKRISEINACSLKNKEKAKKASSVRWGKNINKDDATSIAQELLDQCHPKAISQKPSIILKENGWPDNPYDELMAKITPVDLTKESWPAMNMAQVLAWMANGFDFYQDVIPTINSRIKGKNVRSWSYFDGAILTAHNDRTKKIMTTNGKHSDEKPKSNIYDFTPERWRLVIDIVNKNGNWDERLGPPPDQPGTNCPPEFRNLYKPRASA